MKRLLSTMLSATMLLSALAVPASAAGDKAKGTPPTYNEATGCYEISTPEQLVYLSGTWKDPAYRTANFVLTADIDMAGIEGFKPIASKKNEGYLGTFDGQFHAIKNLKIDYPKKYVGLFGYVGNENEPAFIKNVALLDCEIHGQQNVGGLVGVAYGTITNCLVTGKVRVDDLSNSHTGGGIAGKVKEGEGPVVGKVDNCYVDAILEAPYDVGGIAGIQDGGGYVGHSFATGSVEAYGDQGAAGGIAGSFNAGQDITGCVSAQTFIKGTQKSDKIVGQLDDESAYNIVNNIAWEGTSLQAVEPDFQPIQWEDVSTAKLQDQQTYIDLGWDFDKDWSWNEETKSPYLKGFDASLFEAPDYTVSGTRLISRALNEADQNGKAQVSLRVVGDETVASAVVHYSAAQVIASEDLPTFDVSSVVLDQTVEMKGGNGVYTASLPTDKAGYIFYYIEVKTDKGTYYKPYDKNDPIRLFIDDGTILGAPAQITLVPDTKQGNIRVNWVTVPEVRESVVKYRVKGASEWNTVKGTSFVDAVTPGWKELATHQAVLADLPADAEIEYQVGDGKDFMSQTYTFRAPAAEDADSFSFIFVADPQSVTQDDYMSFKKSMDYATKLTQPAFIVSGGDTTQDGYKATEWENCFAVMGDYYASIPTITVPGNHEMKGDWGFVSFAQRFNMPGGKSGTEFDNTIGCFEYGDACIIALNTEVTPPAEKPEIIQKQLKWAKECYEKSDKKWRIMVVHAGPYTSNHDPLEVRDLFINDSPYSIDALGVDLFLNGHDHIYIRSCAKGDERAELGEGTTYITGGTVGNKYYEYMPDRSDKTTVNYHDDEDRQTFSIITVSEDSINGKAYWCLDDDTDAKEEAESWDNWVLADNYTIRNTLRETKADVKLGFTDVKDSDWYYDNVAYVVGKNLFKGDTETTFAPAAGMTRAMVATVLYRLAGEPETDAAASFTDVPADAYYAKAVAWAASEQIVSGTGDNKFSPNLAVTREEIAAMLYRYADAMGKVPADGWFYNGASYTDAAAVSSWAKQSVEYCSMMGVVSGKDGGRFDPKGSAQRCEFAAMIDRFAA